MGLLMVWKRLAYLLAVGIFISAACHAGSVELPKVVINGDSGAVVESGSTVTVLGSVDLQQVQSTWLMVDRRGVASKAGSGKYALAWNTQGAGTGQHFLEVAAVSANGAKKIVFRAEVDIVSTTPTTLSCPAGEVSVGAPQKIGIACVSGHTPARAMLYVDGVAGAKALPVTGGSVDWDAGAVATGDHTLSAVVWDSGGFIAYSRAIPVKVPGRLFVKAPEPAVVTADQPDLVLAIAIPDGVEVRKLTACISDKPIAESSARCSEMKLPAIDIESGPCAVSVEMVDSHGATHKWGPCQVTIDNRYKAEIAAKAAADKAASDAEEKAKQDRVAAGSAAIKAEEAAAEARDTAKAKQKRLNDWVFSGGYRDAAKQDAIDKARSRSALGNSGGTIGRARGMCVVEVGDTIEFGAIFTVTAKVTPGRGTVSVNATDVDEDFLDSITSARKYIIGYVKKTGYNVDWMKTNIDLHYQRSGPMGGDSCGAAIATAILSSLLKVPIRNEVVMTGAIEPDGTVNPVGAVDMKAAAAFTDPTVLTIIVPRFADNVADVLSLPPKILAGHRLIAASDLSQVFRQSLVGYDQGTSDAASKLFTQGLALYSNAKVDEAVAKLEEAAKYTPEDLTIPIWIKAMKTPPAAN